MHEYLIYKFTSPSGKSYIGQTNNFSRRKSQHKHASSTCSVLHTAIKKYGFENFNIEILAEKLDVEEANILEEQYIKEHNTLIPNGYNVLYGGKNYTRTEEHKQILSKSKKGIPLSYNHRQNLSIAKKGKPGYMKGIPRLESTKQKISNTSMGRSLSPESLEKRTNTRKGQKWKINPETGKRVYYFPVSE